MKVMFIVGSRATGKTYTINKYLEETNEKKLIIDTGPIMRELHKNSGCKKDIVGWMKELELQYGKDISSKIIAEEIEKKINESSCDDIIIIGYRTFDSLKYLIDKFNIEDFVVLYIDGPISLLYDNYCKREGRKITFNEFEYNINQEQKHGLIKLKACAMLGCEKFEYFYKKTNDDSFEYILKDFFNKNKIKELKLNG